MLSARTVRCLPALRHQRRITLLVARWLVAWWRVPRPASERWTRIVAAVARRVPDARCLSRAVAAAAALAAWRRRVRLCIGVARDPAAGLRAHAWVEEDGRPLGEDLASAYRPLRRVQRRGGGRP